MTSKSHNHKSNQAADALDCGDDLFLLPVFVSIIDFHSLTLTLLLLLDLTSHPHPFPIETTNKEEERKSSQVELKVIQALENMFIFFSSESKITITKKNTPQSLWRICSLSTAVPQVPAGAVCRNSMNHTHTHSKKQASQQKSTCWHPKSHFSISRHSAGVATCYP